MINTNDNNDNDDTSICYLYYYSNMRSGRPLIHTHIYTIHVYVLWLVRIYLRTALASEV